ncbi:uncharacterized protein LOC131994253 [Stomoxys calcitrans]|uniref:uncharacterized protein LOC131994253 n=1 Tax=Stomoxys calcitrans TaxID=35570 RepID=UPI0027E27C86|nr:uncharacterized protein LOC131994253 [Stomoxys calcitrans]
MSRILLLLYIIYGLTQCQGETQQLWFVHSYKNHYFIEYIGHRSLYDHSEANELCAQLGMSFKPVNWPIVRLQPVFIGPERLEHYGVFEQRNNREKKRAFMCNAMLIGVIMVFRNGSSIHLDISKNLLPDICYPQFESPGGFYETNQISHCLLFRKKLQTPNGGYF